MLGNNAGAMFTSRHVTPDGFEQTFALNHLVAVPAHDLLLEWLIASRVRVVTTSSDAHRGGLLDLDDLQCERGRLSSPAARTSTSKLCNILFTRELQRRKPGIAASCFHPGVIRSGLRHATTARCCGSACTVIGPFLRSPVERRQNRWCRSRSIPPAGELTRRVPGEGAAGASRARRRRTTASPPSCGNGPPR